MIINVDGQVNKAEKRQEGNTREWLWHGRDEKVRRLEAVRGRVASYLVYKLPEASCRLRRSKMRVTSSVASMSTAVQRCFRSRASQILMLKIANEVDESG